MQDGGRVEWHQGSRINPRALNATLGEFVRCGQCAAPLLPAPVLPRRRHEPPFKEREGFSLTYLFFVAVVLAGVLEKIPHLNASVGDDSLSSQYDLNIGVAVDLDDERLVVSVIRHADRLDLFSMSRAIRDHATNARSKRLSLDDLNGGTFTITNPGRFGTLMTGAIINQPQVAILATDGATRRHSLNRTPGTDL